MDQPLIYRKAIAADIFKLSILFKQVYIQTYGTEGVSDEFANFITGQFSPERLKTTIEQYPSQMIVAEYKGNLVGVAEIEMNKQNPVNHIIAPELNKLYILEWFCGKGIGRQLLAEAEKEVKANGFNELWLWVLISNTRAITFYEKHGFTWIGNAFFQMEENNYENKVMLKKLSE